MFFRVEQVRDAEAGVEADDILVLDEGADPAGTVCAMAELRDAVGARVEVRVVADTPCPDCAGDILAEADFVARDARAAERAFEAGDRVFDVLSPRDAVQSTLPPGMPSSVMGSVPERSRP